MKEFISILIIVFVVVMVSFIIFNIKYFVKGEEFKKSCSTTGESCACSTDDGDKTECVNDHDHEHTHIHEHPALDFNN